METSGPRRYITDGPTLLQQAVRIAPLVVAYFLAREVAFLVPASDKVLSAVWPASGIALAALLITPRRLWAAILAALFVTGSAGNLLAGRPLFDSLGFATASILETLASAAVIVRWCGVGVRFTRTRDVIALTACATVVNAGTACVGAATAAVGESIPFWRFWLDWWVSNGLGILLVTPFVVAWLERPGAVSAPRWTRVAEWASFMGLWVAMTATMFHEANSLLEPQPYMLTALITWPALRFGRRTVTLAFLTLAAFSVTAEAARTGALLPSGGQTNAMVSVQVFLALTLVAALLLTASHAETTSAERAAREGHDRVRAIGDNLPASMVYEAVREPDGTTRFLHVSAGCEAVNGVPAAALLADASAFYGLIVEADRARVAAAEEAAATAMSRLQIDARFRRPDGELRWMHLGASPRRLAGGRLLWDGIEVDVTERVRAAELQSAMFELSEAAHQSGSLDQLYARIHSIVRRLMEARNLYVALYDPATDLIRFPYFVDEVDPVPEPLPPGRGMTGYVLRSGRPLLATPEVLADLQERGEIEPLGAASVDWLGVPLIVGDQTMGVLAVQSYTEGVRYGEREKGILTFVSRQVALAIERKRSEDALRGSEERYRTLFEQSPVGLYQTTPDGRVVAANPALLRMLGYESFAEMSGLNLEEIVVEPGSGRASAREALELDGAVWGLESAWRTKDGAVVFVRENARAVRGGGGALLCYEGTVEDITRWRAVKEEHRRLMAAIEQAAETIVITDTEGRIQYVNPAFERITGYTREEAIGRKPSVLKSGRHDEAFYRELWRTITRGEIWQGHFVNRRKDGGVYEEDATISPIRDPAGTVVNFVAVKRDVTQEVALEAQLRQAQKMEAIGNLAGGVAHDFNNLLQVMLSQTQLLRSRPATPERAEELVRRLEEEIQHGASLTRQLLLFSRRETAKRERIDLNAAILEATQILRRLVRANIELALEPAPEAVFVEADRGELQQVLMNLTLNASDAMPDGGKLSIRIDAVGEDEACVAVADTGHGIPQEIIEKVFEPFFTTKEAGKGTGLGLSVVHGIVTRMGGRVEVESELGRGSTFRVVLARAPREGGAAFGVRPGVPEPTPGRGERILVVEDEEGAREGLRDLLLSLGYGVVAVGSGEQAWALPPDPPFDLLLTDLMLPGATGTQVAAGLQARWPRLQVVLMSGYAEDEVVRRGVGGGTVRFLQKPFGMAALAAEVRDALDQRRDPGET